jgi:4-hydroxy-tetrahydrodipicolinate synthase
MTQEHGGVIIPMVTPFNEDQELDTGALRRLCSYLIESGVHGLFPFGSTGEFFALTPEEKERILDVVVEEAAGRVMVYAGTGAVSTKEAIRLAQMAEAHGADGLCVITPFYLAPSSEELYEHYLAITQSTHLPVLCYNNPNRTGVNVSVDVIARLAETENFVGIKDSSGDVSLTAQYVVNTPPDFAVIQGRDDLFYPSFVVGTVGAVAATGNVVPELVVEIYEAFMAGEWERALAAQTRLSQLRRALSLGTFPVVIKEAMAIRGNPAGPSRLPVKPLAETARARLRAILTDMEVL